MTDPDAQPWAILCVSAAFVATITGIMTRSLMRSATSKGTSAPLAIVGGLRLWLLGTCVVAIVATKMLLGSEPFAIWGDDGETQLMFEVRDMGLTVAACGLISIPLELTYVGIVAWRSGERLWRTSSLLLVPFCILIAFMLMDVGLFVPMV